MGTREAGFASACPDIASSRAPPIARNWPRYGTSPPQRIPPARGLAYPDIIEAAVGSSVRALWIIATNPMVSFPNHEVLKQASRSWNSSWCRTAFIPRPRRELADLVLPAAMWGEKEGTYTNSERRVSKVNRAVAPPARSRPDFDIFLDLAGELGERDELFPGVARTARRVRRMEAGLGRPPVRLQRA